MSQEAEEVRVFGNGHVYVAEVDSDFPDTISDEIDTDDWIELGFISEEGPRPKFGRTEKDLKAWQSPDPVRSLVTETPKSIEFTLLQVNGFNTLLAFGGGEIIEDAPGEYTFEPPDTSENKEWAMIVEGFDDDVTTRICYRRVKQVKELAFAFIREDATKYDLEMKVLAADEGQSSFFVQTDDPAFADAVTSS